MVDIIHISVGVDELHEILDDLDHVLLGQYVYIVRNRHVELAVDTIAAYLAQVVTLLAKEQVLDHLACCCIISRLCVTQLAIDIEHSLLLRVRGVLLQGVEDDREVALASLLLVEQNGLGARLQDTLNSLGRQFLLALQDDLVTLDGNYLTGVLIYEVLRPCFQYVTGQTATYILLQFSLGTAYLFGQVEAVQDILIRLKTDSTQQGGHRQFLLTIDVSVHHLVDIRCELNPRATERNDTGRVELRSVTVYRRAEEHTRRTVQLTNDHALSAVDHKRTLRRHVGDGTQEDVLDNGIKILMIRIRARQLEFSLQGHTIGQTTLDALLDGVTRMIYIIVQKFQVEAVAGVGDGEVLHKHLVQALATTLFRRTVQLEEIVERLQLNLQKVTIRHLLLNRREVDSL